MIGRMNTSFQMDWRYLAGFTDGDGCITIETSKGKYRYSRLRWSQKASDSLVLGEIARFLRSEGLKVSERNVSAAWKGHRYPQCELGITNAEDTRRALREMVPYLIVKKQRAMEALTVLDEVAELKKLYGNKYRHHMTTPLVHQG